MYVIYDCNAEQRAAAAVQLRGAPQAVELHEVARAEAALVVVAFLGGANLSMTLLACLMRPRLFDSMHCLSCHG